MFTRRDVLLQGLGLPLAKMFAVDLVSDIERHKPRPTAQEPIAIDTENQCSSIVARLPLYMLIPETGKDVTNPEIIKECARDIASGYIPLLIGYFDPSGHVQIKGMANHLQALKQLFRCIEMFTVHIIEPPYHVKKNWVYASVYGFNQRLV